MYLGTRFEPIYLGTIKAKPVQEIETHFFWRGRLYLNLFFDKGVEAVAISRVVVTSDYSGQVVVNANSVQVAQGNIGFVTGGRRFSLFDWSWHLNSVHFTDMELPQPFVARLGSDYDGSYVDLDFVSRFVPQHIGSVSVQVFGYLGDMEATGSVWGSVRGLG